MREVLNETERRNELNLKAYICSSLLNMTGLIELAEYMEYLRACLPEFRRIDRIGSEGQTPEERAFLDRFYERFEAQMRTRLGGEVALMIWPMNAVD